MVQVLMNFVNAVVGDQILIIKQPCGVYNPQGCWSCV